MIGLVFAFAADSVVLFVGLRYLRSRPVDVTPAMVAATLPWFGLAGFLYAVQQGVALPALIDPFAVSPIAYLTTGCVVVVLWIVVDAVRPSSLPVATALSGGGLLIVGGASLLALRPRMITELVFWNSVAILGAISITVLVWVLVGSTRHVAAVSALGWSTVFAHVFDAVTTALGLEVFGTVERNPVSAAVISAGELLLADGAGVFLFLVIKIVAALGVVWLAAGVGAQEREGTGMLVVAGGVGLAPAVHNLVLFSLTVF
ncbi:DUF63 family protein [Haloplanus salinus]|nr:DUF63 family protein [Haloplanus salinus]